MSDTSLEEKNILVTVTDQNDNEISYHLDRIPSYSHRYISYLLFNGTQFLLARYNTQREAIMYATWIKTLYKGPKC